MSQPWAHLTVAAIWAVAALPALAAGLAGWDPVGRLGRTGVGPRVNSRWAWFLMELLALVTFPAIYLASDNFHLVGNAVVGPWLAHYGHRGFVWCALVPKRDATVPLTIDDVHRIRRLQPDKWRLVGLVHGPRRRLSRSMADGPAFCRRSGSVHWWRGAQHLGRLPPPVPSQQGCRSPGHALRGAVQRCLLPQTVRRDH